MTEKVRIAVLNAEIQVDNSKKDTDVCFVTRATLQTLVDALKAQEKLQLTNSTTASFPLLPDEYPKRLYAIKYCHEKDYAVTEEMKNSYQQEYFKASEQDKSYTGITDNTETLNNALKRIAELERDKPVDVTVQASQLTDDLIGLIMRLSWKLGSEHKMSKLAMDFLERKGLVPSPLRTDNFKKLCDEVDEELKILEGGERGT